MPNDSKSMDGETLEVLWAFKRVNDTLIAGLEFAVHTMEKWDSLSQEMQKSAESRGGRCISKMYINAHSKLRWQCAVVHKWEAIPMNIKAGSWYPVCARSK